MTLKIGLAEAPVSPEAARLTPGRIRRGVEKQPEKGLIILLFLCSGRGVLAKKVEIMQGGEVKAVSGRLAKLSPLSVYID